MVPLILTLRLDDDSFRYFNQLRKTHFPPERNVLDAHLTLFHHLPTLPAIHHDIAAAAATTFDGPLQLNVSGLLKLGGGVAFKIESAPLVQLHRRLQQAWQPLLTRQDQQGLRPHITVQNKVPAAEAQLVYNQLAGSFHPFTALGMGLDLYEYHGGPWQHHRYIPFE